MFTNKKNFQHSQVQVELTKLKNSQSNPSTIVRRAKNLLSAIILQISFHRDVLNRIVQTKRPSINSYEWQILIK